MVRNERIRGSRRKQKMDPEIKRSSPQPRYSFIIDPEQSPRDVDFIMVLVDAEGRHTDPNEARERIDSLDVDVRYRNYFNSSAALVAATDQATYERLFQTTLELVPSHAGFSGYTQAGYREPVHGQPLPELADIIRTAHLSYVRRPL